MTQITIRIDDDQKERWEQAIEDDYRASNMTNLIKIAVEDYIDENELLDDN